MRTEGITFIIPAYNVEKYVGQCLESLVRQTCDKYKVIIIDDGSRDGTADICQKYVKQYPDKFRYYWQKNQGQGAARNNGLKQCIDTIYTSFLDSDDWLNVRFVEIVLEQLKRYDDEGIDMVFTLPVMYDNLIGQTRDWLDKPLFDQIFTETTRVVETVADTRLYGLEVNICRRVYRTDFLERINFAFPEGVKWEDVFPHYYLLNNSRKVLGVPDVGFYYRTNVPTSTTSTSGRDRLNLVPVFNQTLKYLLDSECNAEILNYALNNLVVFSIWSTSVAKREIRRELVKQLHGLYASIPGNVAKNYMRARRKFGRKNALFFMAVRHRWIHKLLSDYMTVSIATIAISKCMKGV